MLIDDLTAAAAVREPSAALSGREVFLATFLTGPAVVLATVVVSVAQAPVAVPLGLSLVVVWAVFLAWVLACAARAVQQRRGHGEAVAARTLALLLTPFVLVAPTVELVLALS